MKRVYAVGIDERALAVELTLEKRTLILDSAGVSEHALAVVPAVLGLANVCTIRVEVCFLHLAPG
jgi:hypothetical protein